MARMCTVLASQKKQCGQLAAAMLGQGDADLEAGQVCEALHEGWLGGEPLVECIAKVMRGISGHYEHILSTGSERDAQRTGRGCLANAALATHKDPAKRRLVNKVPKRRLRHCNLCRLTTTHSSQGWPLSQHRHNTVACGRQRRLQPPTELYHSYDFRSCKFTFVPPHIKTSPLGACGTFCH